MDIVCGVLAGFLLGRNRNEPLAAKPRNESCGFAQLKISMVKEKPMSPQLLQRVAVLLLLAIGALPAALGQAGMRAALILPGQRTAAPEFQLQDSSGKAADIKSYRGKIVLLDFWATWCHG